MLFVDGQIAKINSVFADINLFWSPKKRQLFFNQLFKYRMLLLVIACDIDRLPKKHRLGECVVFGLGKDGIVHWFLLTGYFIKDNKNNFIMPQCEPKRALIIQNTPWV